MFSFFVGFVHISSSVLTNDNYHFSGCIMYRLLIFLCGRLSCDTQFCRVVTILSELLAGEIAACLRKIGRKLLASCPTAACRLRGHWLRCQPVPRYIFLQVSLVSRLLFISSFFPIQSCFLFKWSICRNTMTCL